MARRSRSGYGESRRDSNWNTNQRLPTLKLSSFRPSQYDLFDLLTSRDDLLPVEDRRTFHPDGPVRPARSFLGLSNYQLKPVDPRQRLSTEVPRSVGFDAPRDILVCVRRKIRQEVMHALGHAGKGSRQRKPRFNENSDIHC